MRTLIMALIFGLLPILAQAAETAKADYSSVTKVMVLFDNSEKAILTIHVNTDHADAIDANKAIQAVGEATSATPTVERNRAVFVMTGDAKANIKKFHRNIKDQNLMRFGLADPKTETVYAAEPKAE